MFSEAAKKKSFFSGTAIKALPNTPPPHPELSGHIFGEDFFWDFFRALGGPLKKIPFFATSLSISHSVNPSGSYC